MDRPSLKAYVIAVVLVMLVVLGLVWFLRGPEKARATGVFFLGFLLGMLAMYIAVHIYGI